MYDEGFYAGKITEVTGEGMGIIPYDDSTVETLNISEESWNLIPENAAHTSTAQLRPKPQTSVPKDMLYMFGDKPFM